MCPRTSGLGSIGCFQHASQCQAGFGHGDTGPARLFYPEPQRLFWSAVLKGSTGESAKILVQLPQFEVLFFGDRRSGGTLVHRRSC